MSRSHPLARPFRRHLRAVQRSLGPALAGEEQALHQCRVATRRLRELAPLLAAELGPNWVRKSRSHLRAVDRALGPVREIDVALRLLGDWAGDDHRCEDAVVRVRQHLVDVRASARRRMVSQLDGTQTTQIGRRLLEIGAELEDTTSGAWTRTLSLQMTRRAQQLRAAVAAAGALYVPDRVHAVRIVTKKLRYAFELVHDAGATRRRVPAQRLRQVQDTLDRVHDIEVLTRVIRQLPAPPSSCPPWVAHLDELRHELEEECRRRHAEFIGQRRQLLRASGAALDTAIQLWNRRVGSGSQTAPLKMTLAGERVPRSTSDRRIASGR